MLHAREHANHSHSSRTPTAADDADDDELMIMIIPVIMMILSSSLKSSSTLSDAMYRGLVLVVIRTRVK